MNEWKQAATELRNALLDIPELKYLSIKQKRRTRLWNAVDWVENLQELEQNDERGT